MSSDKIALIGFMFFALITIICLFLGAENGRPCSVVMTKFPKAEQLEAYKMCLEDRKENK